MDLDENELRKLFCTTCSFQFNKKIVYDIHMSFVHKIDKKQSNNEKLTDIQQEDDDLMENNDSIISQNSVQQNNDFDSKHEENEHGSQTNAYKSDRKKPTQDTSDKKLKPHNCEMCDYSTTTKQNLKVHVESVHERIKPHKCLSCDYSTAIKKNLVRHIESIHKGKKLHK